uniref:BolA n=1 Tax=Griffithsia japonica TaxID=83288 RepID=Q7XZ17_GRIJA|nr:BolA [Griffithsia japonica]
MLAKIKDQVNALQHADEEPQGTASFENGQAADEPAIDPSRPVYSAIIRKLNVLKPMRLDVMDNSAAHAGHAGSRGLGDESHFAVSVVSEAFEGLSIVQRHRVIYTLLNEEMSSGHIHALQIEAKTPFQV